MAFEDLLAGLYKNNLISTTASPEPTTTPVIPPNNIQPNPFAELAPVVVQPAIVINQPVINTAPNPFIEATPIEPVSNPFETNNISSEATTLFSVEAFRSLLKAKVSAKNKNYQEYSSTINAYDMFSCIRIPYFRINTYPVPDYSSSYLPVELRCTMGTAIHDFIQDVEGLLTETEVCLKVPELNMSVRLDGLINHNVLVEIKSCGYADYEKILKSNKPRTKDFYQTSVYKWLLENYLDVMKLQPPSRSGVVPKLDKYDIQTIQFVYVCHELIAAEADTIGESIEAGKVMKRQLDSKRNQFWFMKVLTVDLTKIDMNPYLNYIKEKQQHIKYFLDNKIVPPLDNKFIDRKDCFFCMYSKICPTAK